MFLKTLKYSSLILLTIVIAVVGFLLYQFTSVDAQTAEFDFAGFIWSENYGWISLNYQNCLLLAPSDCLAVNPRIEYKVSIDSGNNIKGYAWSENVGWVCFGDGEGDDTVGCVGVPPSGSLDTTMEGITGKVTGWAKVISMGSDGWIKIGRGGNEGTNFGEDCYDCQPKCDLWTMTSVPNPPGPDILVPGPPCIVFSETEFDTCTTCFTDTRFDAEDIFYSGNTEAVVGGSGYICTGCVSCKKVDGAVSGSRIVCNASSGGSCPSNVCERYGVNINDGDGALLGWSWSGDGTGGVSGAGWVHFNTEFSASHIVFPWLQTIYGSIYTPGQVKQRASVEGKNATYCIFAQDINENIKSQNCEDISSGLVEDVEAGFLEKFGTQEVYRNALGKLDIDGLITGVAVSGTRNKYGHLVNYNPAAAWNSDKSLNGEVYYFDSDLSISAGLNILNGTAGNKGSGTVIIDGNLTINGDITYDSGMPATLGQLASVVWIVKGDVIINGSVENIVGAFIVLGDGLSTCQTLPSSDPEYPRYNHNGCGVFTTVEVPGESSDKPLTVLGPVIARAFDFGRVFSEIIQGSERIIYDGRLTANPPPGLESFVGGLPIIRDFAY